MILLLAAALIRFVDLGGWSLWNDEIYTLLVLPVSPLLAQGIPIDQHPPLYYLLLEKWLTLGDGEFFMRLPSAAAGWLAVLMMWPAGRALGGNRLGLLAAVLLAFSPIHIWYSREARMYGLASFFWLATIYFYIMLFSRDSWLDVLGLAASTIAAIYTAYPSLALWVMQLALFLPAWHWHGRQRHLVARWLVTQLIIVAGLAVWWPFLQVQLARSSPFFWLGMSLTLADTFLVAMIGAGVFAVAANLVWLLIIGRPIFRAQWPRWSLPVAWLIVSIFIVFTIMAATGRGLSVRRQLLVFWPLFILLTSWALLYLSSRRLNAIVIGLCFLLGFWTAFGPAYEDWRGAAELVASSAAPDDQVWVTTGGAEAALDYYLSESPAHEAVVPTDLENQPPKSGSRIWLVTNDHPSTAGLHDSVRSWFNENAIEQSSYQFSRYITVKVYGVP